MPRNALLLSNHTTDKTCDNWHNNCVRKGGAPVCYYSVLSLCNVRGSALESLSTPVLGECITYMEETAIDLDCLVACYRRRIILESLRN